MKKVIGTESGGVLDGVRNSDFPLMEQVEKFENKYGEMNLLEKETKIFGKKLEESIFAIIESTKKDDSFEFINLENINSSKKD